MLVSIMHERKVCARYMLGVLGRRHHSRKRRQRQGYTAKELQILELHHGFFLFTERTDDEVERLLCDLDQCPCRLLDTGVLQAHQKGREMGEGYLVSDMPDKPLRPSISLIVNFFRLLMTTLNQAHVRSVAKRKSPIWPTCPDDLMPFGPDTSPTAFSNGLALSRIRWYRSGGPDSQIMWSLICQRLSPLGSRTMSLTQGGTFATTFWM